MILCGRRVLKFGGHGKDVAENLLKRNDFEQVEYNENYVPQIGDIMSMPFSSKSKHNYGHVAIWNGYRWVSDFVQQKQWVIRRHLMMRILRILSQVK